MADGVFHAVLFDVGLHLDGFLVAFEVEVERSGDDAGEGFRLVAALDELLGGTYEAVFRAELADGAAGDTRHGVGKMRIAEAAFRRLDVRFVRLFVEAVFWLGKASDGLEVLIKEALFQRLLRVLFE